MPCIGNAGRICIYYFIDRLMDGVFETFEYSKFQDVNETIATTWLSIFIVEIHMKKQHKAQFGMSNLLQCSVADGLQAACLQA